MKIVVAWTTITKEELKAISDLFRLSEAKLMSRNCFMRTAGNKMLT